MDCQQSCLSLQCAEREGNVASHFPVDCYPVDYQWLGHGLACFIQGGKMANRQNQEDPKQKDSSSDSEEIKVGDPDLHGDDYVDKDSRTTAKVVEDEILLQRMLEGNIGLRPDFQRQFLQVASMAAVGGKCSKDNPANIVVIACGPVAMIQAIKHLCNNSGSRTSGDPIFTFTEDD
jgi:hypothetical protein